MGRWRDREAERAAEAARKQNKTRAKTVTKIEKIRSRVLTLTEQDRERLEIESASRDFGRRAARRNRLNRTFAEEILEEENDPVIRDAVARLDKTVRARLGKDSDIGVVIMDAGLAIATRHALLDDDEYWEMREPWDLAIKKPDKQGYYDPYA